MCNKTDYFPKYLQINDFYRILIVGMNMKIKQTSLLFAILVGFMGLIVAPTTYAATCGGVTTNLIECSQSDIGSCSDGSPPQGGKCIGKCSDGSTPFNGKCTDPTATYTAATYTGPSSVSTTGIWGVLLTVINILTAGIVIAAIAGIVYGSILYTTAGGKPEQVKKASTVIVNTLLGIVAYALMFAFLNFIIPGGLLT